VAWDKQRHPKVIDAMKHRHLAGPILFVLSCVPSLMGCGSSSNNGPTIEEQPGETCTPGIECTCAEFQTGFSACDAEGNYSCDCSLCPTLMPTSNSSSHFMQCGGDPTGAWQLVSIDYAGQEYKVTDSNTGGIYASCPAEITPLSDVVGGFLVLSPDAIASMNVTTGATARFMSSCVYGCEQLTGTNCREECGQCICEETVTDALPDGDWSVSDWVLSMNGGASQFCVEGTTLTLESGGMLEFQKIAPIPGCAAESYGKTPSCPVIAYSQATCAEKAPLAPCEQLGDTQCDSTPGCTKQLGCSGVGNTCSDYSGGGCTYYGCTLGSNGYSCSGWIGCSSQTDSLHCIGFGCDWEPCTGTRVPCASLSVDECATSPGCGVVAL
jgi:hypothetical protein